jgi:hypothetical protein
MDFLNQMRQSEPTASFFGYTIDEEGLEVEFESDGEQLHITSLALGPKGISSKQTHFVTVRYARESTLYAVNTFNSRVFASPSPM